MGTRAPGTIEIYNRVGMNKYDILRQTLFDQLSRDLATTNPELAGTVLCPLCLGRFWADSLHSKTLTIEHIIPSKLGGTDSTLTCKACNNRTGAAGDNHFIRAIKALDTLESNGTFRASLGSDDGQISVDFTCRSGTPEDPIDIQIVHQASNPTAVKSIPGMLRSGQHLHLKFNFGLVSELHERGVLRAAYLSVFKALGYRYAMSLGGMQVREILKGKGKIPNVIVQAHPNMGLRRQALVLPFQKPDAFSFFLVLLKLRRELTRYLAVLLPSPDGCDFDELTNIVDESEKIVYKADFDDSGREVIVHFTREPIEKLRSLSQDR
jgi:hypothetical protein